MYPPLGDLHVSLKKDGSGFYECVASARILKLILFLSNFAFRNAENVNGSIF